MANYKEITILLLTIFSIFLLLSLPTVAAHEEGVIQPTQDTSNLSNPINYIKITAVFLFIIITFILTFGKEIVSKNKKLFFWLIVIPIILSSLYLASFTIYENISSESKGPIHWHADYQVIVCGEKIDLINPKFPSNKIGSPTLHEHNDQRIHIEGSVKKFSNVNLGNYFKVIDGELEQNHLIYPTDTKNYNFKNGDSCPDGKSGTLKVYVNGGKIEDFDNYIIYPNSKIPPGDCIIVLFDDSSSITTNILCDSWAVQGWNYKNLQRRTITIGGKTWQ